MVLYLYVGRPGTTLTLGNGSVTMQKHWHISPLVATGLPEAIRAYQLTKVYAIDTSTPVVVLPVAKQTADPVFAKNVATAVVAGLTVGYILKGARNG